MKEGLNCNIALFSIDGENKRIKEHCSKGGIAIYVDEKNCITILKGQERIPVIYVYDIPLTLQGKAEFMTENVLPVTLACYLLNFSLDAIKDSLQRFKPSWQQTPGRLNMFDIDGIHVILDYAHNPHSLKAFGKYIKTLNGEVTGIITGVGDRLDEDIREVGRIAAQMYDKIIIRFDEDTRDRTPEEIGSLIIDGIEEIDPVKEYTIISDIENALMYALENSKKGSYIILSADDQKEIIDLLKDLSDTGTPVIR